jgi:ribosomal protein S18 acetylase RimI-like enzyme
MAMMSPSISDSGRAICDSRPVASVVQIRDAQPADAPLIAWDLETATDRMFSIMLGADWEAVLIRAVSIPGHAWSVALARIAEIDGRAVGVILSGPAQSPPPSLEMPRAWTRLRAAVIGFAFRPFLSFMKHHESGEWYITAVSVMPEARGHGVGAALLRDAAEQARAAGMASVTLDVDKKNHTARRLYAREGFALVASSPRAWLAGGIQVLRMRKGI